MLERDYEIKLEKINSVEDYNTRIREGKWPELESCLYLWHYEMERHNLPISDSLFETKSTEFAYILGIIFKHSSGWISNFKKRFGLKRVKIVGEAASVRIVKKCK
jgi:hypothetical protein